VKNDTDLFKLLLSPEFLIQKFFADFSTSQSKGVDRLNGFQFSGRATGQLSIASIKCLSGEYRFSPYLENLKVKGRGKEPRLISIPCIRDRVVLNQLNIFLAHIFPECVPRNIANSYVREISTDLAKHPLETTFVCGCDIQKFYDAIKRDNLIKVLSSRIKCPEALALIRHALDTPTVPKNTRRSSYSSYRNPYGVPQGLAISNILAAIYLRDVDAAMHKFPIKYYRYVDDVLMYGAEDVLRKARSSLMARLRSRGLTLHGVKSNKSHFAPLTEDFGYLGYRFSWPKITVRDSTIERLLQSLAAKFSDYSHNKAKRLERFKYLDEKRLAEIFILELNERITGAISENKRFGWIAYFSQITDLRLLHHLDATVERLFLRMEDFNRKAPASLKKFRRAFFEMRFNPTGGYVRNYDIISSSPEKLNFLMERGRVNPLEAPLTDEQINERFERYRRRVLSEMHADEADIYG
jgi:retron-type reverse transcriptase